MAPSWPSLSALAVGGGTNFLTPLYYVGGLNSACTIWFGLWVFVQFVNLIVLACVRFLQLFCWVLITLGEVLNIQSSEDLFLSDLYMFVFAT